MAIQKYKGKLGKFEYDDEEFELVTFADGYLRYIGNETDGSKIKIPEGVKNCYAMFYNCENLTKAPVIPEGVKNCKWMFVGCTNLKEAPVIPEGVKNCDWMFHKCRNLRETPIIPESVKNCEGMFCGCTNLTKAPVIPEGVECCREMFKGCTNLKEAPVIPKGVEDCRDMFDGCSHKVQKQGEWNINHKGYSYNTDYYDGELADIDAKIAEHNAILEQLKSDRAKLKAKQSGTKGLSLRLSNLVQKNIKKRELPDIDYGDDDIQKGLGE